MSKATRRDPLPYVVLVLCLATVAHYGGVLSVLAPHLRGYFGIGTDDVGLLYAGIFLTAIVSFAISGPLSDRFGPKPLLVISFLGTAASYGIYALGSDLRVFTAGVLSGALFVPIVTVALPAYLVRLYPAHSRRTMTLTFMTMAVAGVVFPALLDRLIVAHPRHLAYFVHAPYAIVGVVLVLGTLLFLRAPTNGPYTEAAYARPPSLREGLRLLGRPTMALILLLSALHCVSDATMGSWFPIYARERFGEALRHPGDVVALCGLAYVVSRSMLVFVPEGRGRRMLLVLPGLIGGGILLAAIWMDSPAALFWGYPLAAFVWSSQYPALMGEAARRTPRYVSSMFAVSMILALVATAAVTYGVGYFIKTASTTEAMVDALRWLVGAEFSVPWWMPDHRWAITIAPLGFIIFGLVVAVTGLGRRKSQTAPAADAEA